MMMMGQSAVAVATQGYQPGQSPTEPRHEGSLYHHIRATGVPEHWDYCMRENTRLTD
jgi:hypothetical protein